MIRIGIIDDHKLFVEGLTMIINNSSFAKVCATAETLLNSKKILSLNTFDCLLLDISLPDGNGIEFCKEVKTNFQKLPILMLSSYSELSIIERALDAGASGYLLKNCSSEEILVAIKTVCKGEKFICNEVENLLKKETNHKIHLTRREQELLKHIIQGLSNKEIADKMCLGYETIKSYRKNLKVKLNVANTANLVRLALEQKLIDL